MSLNADLEPQQAQLLENICSGPTISAEELSTVGAFAGSGMASLPED
jgi:hypothetical protein